MTPTLQTRFEVIGQNGNCTQAAVASLFDLPLVDVPNFIEGPDFDRALTQFFAAHGYRLVVRSPDSFERWRDRYYLASGPAARGYEHMVVYRGGVLAHDPYPGGRGLLRESRLIFAERE